MKINLLLLFTLISLFAGAQNATEQEVIEKLSDDMCPCLSESDKDIDAMDSNTAMSFFLECFLTAYTKDTDYYSENGFDFIGESEEVLEKFGEKLGFHMVTSCPESISLFMTMAGDELYDDYATDDGSFAMTYTLTGKIVDVNKEQFYQLSVKDTDGRERKLYWLEYIENDYLMESAMSNKKKYIFTYIEKDMYDPRINEYRNMLVITKIEEK